MPSLSRSLPGPFGAVVGALERAVRVRRALIGPRRPSWSPEMETFAELIRFSMHQIGRLPPATQRRVSSAFQSGSELAATTDVERLAVAGCPAAFFRRPGSDPTRMLYYLHGGGYVMGSFETTHLDLLCRLCDASGATVFALDYRLAPEHPYPAAIDDAVTAYRWLLDRGVAPTRLVIAGESAGAGLCLSALQTLRDEGDRLPAAAVALSPWVDLAATSASIRTNRRFDYLSATSLAACRRAYIGRHADARDPRVSSVYADLRGLPPLLVHAGGAEVFLDESVALARSARDAGVEVQLDIWRDMIHAWHVFAALIPEGQHAIECVASWMRSRTGADSADARAPTAARR